MPSMAVGDCIDASEYCCGETVTETDAFTAAGDGAWAAGLE